MLSHQQRYLKDIDPKTTDPIANAVGVLEERMSQDRYMKTVLIQDTAALTQDDIDEIIYELDDKYGGVLEMVASDEEKKEIAKMFRSQKFKFKAQVIDTEDKEDPADIIDKKMEAMRRQGWKVIVEEENYDTYFVFYYMKK